jgi:hypothetical protein
MQKPTGHYRVLYFKGSSIIMGVSDLFTNTPPHNDEGTFILSDSMAQPLDWKLLKDSQSVQSLPPLIQRAIEQALTAERPRPKAQATGRQAMIL